MKLRVLLVVMCAALLVVPAAFAEMSASMSVAADVEINNTLEWKTAETKPDDLTTFAWVDSGRTKVNFDGMLEGDTGWFASGKGQLVLSTGGNAGVDDAWVQMGKVDGFSAKFGRFEGWGSFSKGEDVYIAAAPAQPARYQGDYWRGRFGGNAANIAMYVGGLELGFIAGSADGNSPIIITETDPNTGDTVTRTVVLPFGLNALAFRPVYKYEGEAFVFKIVGEYGSFLPQGNKIMTADYTGDNNFQENRYGGAIDTQFMFGASTVGVSASYGQITGKTVDDRDVNDTTQMAVFGWWKMAVGEANTFGLGLGYAGVEVENVGDDSKLEAYLSYVQQLPVEGLKIKYGASYAGATLDPKAGDSIDNNGFGVRVRFNYDF